MKKNNFLLVVAALLCVSAGAQAAVMDDFGVDGGLSWGLGSAHNSTGTIASRTINTFSVNAFPNYTYAGVQFGVVGQLNFIGQNSEPATVNNSNLKGTSWLVGLGAEYQIPLWAFSAGINFLGRDSLSLNSPTGQPVSYKKPFGYFVKAGYFFLPKISGDVCLSKVSYSTNTVGGVDTNTSADKLSETNYSIGATFHL